MGEAQLLVGTVWSSLSDMSLGYSIHASFLRMRQLEKLIVPESGSEPLHFSSVYAASINLQIKECINRAIVQVRDGCESLEA